MCNYLKIQSLVKQQNSFKVFPIFSFCGHLVQQSQTICAIFVEGHPRNLPVYFKIHPLVKAEKSFKGFSIFRSGGHFVQQNGTVFLFLALVAILFNGA